MFDFGKIFRPATFVALFSIWFPLEVSAVLPDPNFKITSLTESNGNIVLRWQPGTNTGPFQVLRTDSIDNPWESIDEPTTNFTLSAVKKDTIAFYRLVVPQTTSSASGLAVLTAQKPHARVQRSPAIMNVAVPLLQHSQWFGHLALSQTVCSFSSSSNARVWVNALDVGSFSRSHSGKRGRGFNSVVVTNLF